ncbi:hypothetical protein PHLCEN_2v2895 [Hermanssonia centrifuga]|uniref:Alpha/beta hydrolase fold-3 domain-containing protein n=1 Tax=Hermanssonia centrifuga TaxID=98765 RepID=A0A2R6RI95_9APHY|nr:hypothetical protein PHLCEN_2v2895 [Hermanssonia centrifuga]
MTWPLSPFSGGDSPAVQSTSNQGWLNQEDGAMSSLIELLRHFEAPGVPPPPSARVGDPKLKQREGKPIRLWDLWRYGAFVAVKASQLVTALVSHHVRGPPKKSWGIEMTLLTCIMRDVGHHSHLADITMVRMLMGIGGLVPVPSDALVTPVTFRVRKRALRGILSEFDALEDGSRELSGEWVVGKRTWQRLQHEWQASKKSIFESPIAQVRHQPKRKERVILYIHGGAYYFSSPATHRLITIPLSKHLDARLFAVDYRLAPETRFPGPLHDAVSAYFRLIDDLHIPPENIILAGDSAGGGLSLALMMYLRDNRYPLPGGGILMSPWVDLTMSCDSWDSNARYDVVPMPEPGDHLNPIACYLGEHMEKYLTHPYASPLFGDLRGLPPLLIQGGDAEVLRDEITLLAHKASLAGVEVRHELYEDAVHVFQTFPFLDQSQMAFMSAREFVCSVLAPLKEDAPRTLEKKVEEKLKDEINNATARIVQGDGTDSVSEKDDIQSKKTLDSTAAKLEKNVSDDESSSQDEDPSWVTSPSVLPDPKGDTKRRESWGRDGSVRSTTSTRTRTGSVSSSLWGPVSSYTPTSTLRRSHSRPQLSSTRKSDTPTFFPPPREYRIPTASLSSSTSSVPRPSIRRSHGSHPDISQLCAQWANSGPANQTLTYKPDTLPRRRKNSQPTILSTTQRHSEHAA